MENRRDAPVRQKEMFPSFAEVIRQKSKLRVISGDGAASSLEFGPADNPPEDFLEAGAPSQAAPSQAAPGDFKLEKEDIDEDEVIRKQVLQTGCGRNITDGDLVEIRYTVFWEGEKIVNPYLNEITKTFIVGEEEVPPGLEEATKSMLQGEKSKFEIGYKLLLQDRGCFHRIKPNSNGHFKIEVVRVNDSYAQKEEPFQNTFCSAKIYHNRGKDYESKCNLSLAINYFFKAANLLQAARVTCADEQNAQERLLVILYTNLAFCYNKQYNPRKACIVCNEISKLTDMNSHCKGLYQHAIALEAMGHLHGAKMLFTRAHMLRPRKLKIREHLAQLEEKISQEMLLFPQEDVPSDLKHELKSMVEQFSQSNAKKLSLPPDLSPNEIYYIKNIVPTVDIRIILQNSVGRLYLEKL